MYSPPPGPPDQARRMPPLRPGPRSDTRTHGRRGGEQVADGRIVTCHRTRRPSPRPRRTAGLGAHTRTAPRKRRARGSGVRRRRWCPVLVGISRVIPTAPDQGPRRRVAPSRTRELPAGQRGLLCKPARTHERGCRATEQVSDLICHAGGPGHAALVALVAVLLPGRQGPVTNALSALGQRSMTFSPVRSVAWAVLFSCTLHLQVTSSAVGGRRGGRVADHGPARRPHAPPGRADRPRRRCAASPTGAGRTPRERSRAGGGGPPLRPQGTERLFTRMWCAGMTMSTDRSSPGEGNPVRRKPNGRHRVLSLTRNPRGHRESRRPGRPST